jgi:AraC family transcriptional regulator, dual regulator of chb operon
MIELNYIDIFHPGKHFFIADTLFPDANKSIAHTHNFCEFFLLKQGRLTHFINSESTVLSSGDLCFIQAGDSHCFQTLPNPPGGSVGQSPVITNVAFTVDEFIKALAYLKGTDVQSFPNNSRRIHPPESIYQSLLHRCEQLFQLNHHLEGTRSTQLYRTILVEVLLLFIQEEEVFPNTTPTWLLNTCVSMGEPENFRLGIPRFVSLSGKTQEHLTRCMKKYRNCTPSEFINNLRITEAARLLRNTQSGITDIIYACGFENAPYFNRLFKHRYGVPPLRYRFNNYQLIEK